MKAISLTIWSTLAAVTVLVPVALGLYYLVPAAFSIGILWAGGAALAGHYERLEPRRFRLARAARWLAGRARAIAATAWIGLLWMSTVDMPIGQHRPTQGGRHVAA